MGCQGNQSVHVPTLAVQNLLTTDSAQPTPKQKTSGTGSISATLQSTNVTTTGGERSATPTSKPTHYAKTASSVTAPLPLKKSITSCRSSMAAPTMRRTCGRYASRAIPASQLLMETDGGKPQGSIPTSRSHTWPTVASDVVNLNDAHLRPVRPTGAFLARLARG